MKITKLLPLALSLMLLGTTAVSAEPTITSSNSATTELSFTIQPYLDIQVGAQSYTSTVQNIGAGYTGLTIDNFTVPFQVYNNNAQPINVKLTATCDAAGNQVNALSGETSTEMLIAFTNVSVVTDNKATTTDISNGWAGSGVNKNVIVFPFSVPAEFGFVADTGEGGASVNIATGELTYTLNNGTYKPDCSVTGVAKIGTFDTNDENGIYKATLTLSTVSS